MQTTPYTHHGAEVAADKVGEHQWRPVVDGDYYGTRTYLSSRDALRVAQRVAERRAGIVRRSTPFTIDPDDPEPEWVTDLRSQVAS